MGEGDDRLYFHSENNLVLGEGGDDYIYDYWTTNRANTADGGAGDDYVYLGGGDDHAIYHFADNKTAYDRYHGGKGVDTLTLVFDYADVTALLESQLNHMSYSDWVSSVETTFLTSQTSTATFNALGFNLDATHFETLDLVVNNLPEDSAPPEISVADTSVVEGNHGESSYLNFTVSLSHAASTEVSFDFTTMDGTAQSLFNSDMVLNNGRVVFNPGETEKIVQIKVHGDNAYELDETMLFHLQAVEGATLGKAHAVGLIINDDEQNADPLAVDIYNSKADATKVLYIDFDGETISNTRWNDRFEGGNDVVARPYSTDSFQFWEFTAQEQAEMYGIWQIVAEDFAIFDVNVTTDRAVYDSALETDRAMTVVSSNSVYGLGRAFLDSFGSDYAGISFVGPNGTDSVRHYGDTVSHEFGHMLGALHDGIRGGEDYYGGHGELYGGWAPIMGFGSNMVTAQWSQGEYNDASRTEDDIALIQRFLDIREDDHGDTLDDASLLHLAEGHLASGVISTREDVDVFKIITSDELRVRVTVDKAISNLDAYVVIKNEAGDILSESVSSGILFSAQAKFTPDDMQTLYIEVQGEGFLDPATNGYSDYGSLGQYTLDIY